MKSVITAMTMDSSHQLCIETLVFSTSATYLSLFIADPTPRNATRRDATRLNMTRRATQRDAHGTTQRNAYYGTPIDAEARMDDASAPQPRRSARLIAKHLSTSRGTVSSEYFSKKTSLPHEAKKTRCLGSRRYHVH